MMENFNFTIYNPFCCSQQAAESFKYVVYFRNYWGRQCTTCLSSTFVSASSHAHHFYFHLNIFFFLCQIILQIQFYFFHTYIFFPNQKLFYSNRRRSFVELLTVAQIPKLRKSASTNNERHMADSSFGGSIWRLSTTTIPKPSTSEEKALVILCESTSESVSREFQASRAFLFGLPTTSTTATFFTWKQNSSYIFSDGGSEERWLFSSNQLDIYRSQPRRWYQAESGEELPILLDRLSDLVSSSWHLCDANIVVAISQKKKKKKSSEKLPWNGSFFKPSISMAVVTLLHSTFLQV